MPQAARQSRLRLPAKPANVNLTKIANARLSISELQEKMPVAAKRQNAPAFAAADKERDKGMLLCGIPSFSKISQKNALCFLSYGRIMRLDRANDRKVRKGLVWKRVFTQDLHVRTQCKSIMHPVRRKRTDS